MTSVAAWSIAAGLVLILGGCAGNAVPEVAPPPSFSDPTRVTHPLFPVADGYSAVSVGVEDGEAQRVETSLLSKTDTVTVNGQPVEVLQVQSVAMRGERIAAASIHRYAQADDGSVWSLCLEEDPALVMPGQPEVGMVHRPGGRCGVAWEEVRILEMGLTVETPSGPVDGAMLASVLRSDGEEGVAFFAPGHGEVAHAAGDDIEVLAVAVPADAVDESPPFGIDVLMLGALDVFHRAGNGDWSGVFAVHEGMVVAWAELRATDGPTLLELRMTKALDGLDEAVTARNAGQTRHHALAVARAVLDLELRHRPPVAIDVRRFDLWAAQVLVDVEAQNAAGVQSDLFLLERVWERVAPAFGEGGAIYRAYLKQMRTAADVQDLAGAAEAAAQLRDTLDSW